jgi:hypothetical protein
MGSRFNQDGSVKDDTNIADKLPRQLRQRKRQLKSFACTQSNARETKLGFDLFDLSALLNKPQPPTVR